MADRLRIGVDLSILRHAHAGSARWALGLYRALRNEDGLELTGWVGPRRLRRRGPINKVGNLLRERMWFDVTLPRLAARAHRDVLLMPVNLVARTKRLPQVVSILDVNFLSQPGTYDRRYAAYARWQFGRSARDATEVQTISRFSRGEIARYLDIDPARISVIYPGLAPVPERVNILSKGVGYALYVGATEPHKNLGVLIDVWRAGPPGGLKLAIVGRQGRDFARLRELAAPLGETVRVIGGVNAGQLEQWYRRARVFCFPSRTEGFGFPPLEAMQRGVPVVAAAAGSLPEVLGDAARFHDPDDADALRAHVEDLAEEGPARRAVIEHGKTRAAEYSWSRTATAMTDLLRQAAGRR
jgi:glycosyltransferase involved in cell wall biosynthesis